jgi:flavodoxin
VKFLVVYSSLTGNTRRVAEAVYECLPAPKEIYPVEAAPDPDGYDFIALGFWLDKGTADERTRRYIQKINDKYVGVFGTSGVYPHSEHAREAVRRVEKLLSANRVLGSVMCQGRVDEAFAEKMDHIAPASRDVSPRDRNPLEEAKSHPDPADLKNVRTAFRAMLKKIDE